jgi:hypothetical protein
MRPGWNDHCKEKRHISIQWHNRWKAAGKPAAGFLAYMRRSTRADYHRAVKMIKKNEDKLRSENMAKSIQQNNRKLWDEVRKLRGRGAHMPYTVDGETGNENIAGVFANNFKTVFNSVSSNQIELRNIEKKINDLVLYQIEDDITSHLMCRTDFDMIMKRFKSGKSDGNVGLFSDHLIHGTALLYDLLITLFNSMIVHCISPGDMLIGTMVPIPKGKRCNTSCSDNFRGICLQSLLCKILDIFMLNKEKNVLCTSDNQFGFKERMSANMAASIVTETTDYYINKGGTVYALALDASKAFDRVEFSMLFNVLLQKGLNPLYTRLLFYMYTKQRIRVKYNGMYSDYFEVQNGVKQGGVISPTLFTCYVDGLLDRLKRSGVGCKVGSMYTGCISYADDLVLLAPNISSLKTMINICEDYASTFKIKFNGSKSSLMIIDKKRKCDNQLSINVAGEPVEIVSKFKYLGHVLHNDRTNPHIEYLCKDFIMKVNSFLGTFGELSSDIKNTLFQTYCSSFYGSHLCDFNHIENVYVEWRKAIRRVWKIPRRTHTRLLPHIIQAPPLPVILKQRFVNFFYGGIESTNELVRFMFRNALCNNTRMGNNLNLILNSLSLCPCNAYKYSPDMLCKHVFYKWMTCVNEEDVRVATQIQEVIAMRDSHYKSILNGSECKLLIYDLCTN